MNTRILDISPETLPFLGDYSRETSARLTLDNLSDKSVYFKFRCNGEATRSRVTPNRGILKPNEYCEVRIVLEPFTSDPSARNLKFLIEYLRKEDDSFLDTVENVFNGHLGPKPSHLFKCCFSNTNPFAVSDRAKCTYEQTSTIEIETLRKENTELRKQIVALKAELAQQLDSNPICSDNFVESLDFVNIELESSNSMSSVEQNVLSSFQKLLDMIQEKKNSILLELEKARMNHVSNLQTHTHRLAQYKQELTQRHRSISSTKDNQELEVHQDARGFFHDRVLELSQQIIPEPKLHFRIFLPPIQSALDQHVVLIVEK